MKKKRVIMAHYETQWALAVAFHPPTHVLLGKYCWDDATEEEMTIRTFQTRRKAREARKLLNSYREEARVVKINVQMT
jgi:hypothetical protein